MFFTKVYTKAILDPFMAKGDWVFDKIDVLRGGPGHKNLSLFRLVTHLVFFIVYVIVIGAFLLLYLHIILYSEYFISKIILRYGVKIEEFNPDMKEWLKKETRNWKFMDYNVELTWPLKGKENEIRFLSKSDALKFKMVWYG